MKSKKVIWKKMDALYMDWHQFDSLMDSLLTSIIGRCVHPRSFEDNGYWEINTDDFTLEEMEKLLVYGNADDQDREDHAPYIGSGRIKDITATFAVKLLQPKLLFQVEDTVPVKDGVYFLNKGISFAKEYEG